jgi:hypothetical protein
VHIQIPCGVSQVAIVRTVIVHILESSAVPVRIYANSVELFYIVLLYVREAAKDTARPMLGNIHLCGILRAKEYNVRPLFFGSVLLENFVEDLDYILMLALATTMELAYQTHATLEKSSEGMAARRSVHTD